MVNGAVPGECCLRGQGAQHPLPAAVDGGQVRGNLCKAQEGDSNLPSKGGNAFGCQRPMDLQGKARDSSLSWSRRQNLTWRGDHRTVGVGKDLKDH